MKRRTFLTTTGLASTAMLVPSFLRGLEFSKLQASRSGKNLIVIQWSGGNDGLNTFVPYRNDLYYKARPSLGIRKTELLTVDDEMAFHPALQPLQAFYDEGNVCVVNSVGYPNPNRSHFRSMDIWHTGSGAEANWSQGWLGRYLDNQCPPDVPAHHMIEFGKQLSLAGKGMERSAFVLQNPGQIERNSRHPLLEEIGEQDYDEHGQAAYLYKTLINTQESATYLAEKSSGTKTRQSYPFSEFGNQMKSIAELILSDADIRIYYASLGSFDTHANQRNQQERLLKQYAEGVSALMNDLKSHGLLNDTLILTFSEFGRRVKENGSRGTDHGAANNIILMGGKIQSPGFYNAPPDLKDLDEGDIKYDIDFRQVYATILEKWLDAGAHQNLGDHFSPLSFI